MLWLQIENAGEIADGALTLLGASTKEGVEGKIGFFGSGAKYTMSTLLREGIGLRIFSGNREISISTRVVTFGGQTFEQILLDGRDTSFTTRMGPTWEVWFACREFVCNAIDEGGDSIATVDSCSGHSGVTRIYIDARDERVADFVSNIDDYILQTAAIETMSTQFGRVDIVAQSDSDINAAVLYRRRVRIVEIGFNYVSLFRYNFDDIQINESRIVCFVSEYLERIAAALAMSRNVEVVQRFLDSFATGTEYIEHDAKWEYISDDSFTDVWLTVLGTRRIYTPELAKIVGHEDTVGQWMLPRSLVTVLGTRFPTLNIVGRDSDNFLARSHKTMTKRFERSLKRLVAFGYATTARIEVGTFTDDNVMACYRRTQDVIQVSVSHYVKADDTALDECLFEEVCHSNGQRDNSRIFEQYLIHELIKSRQRNSVLDKIIALATKEVTSMTR